MILGKDNPIIIKNSDGKEITDKNELKKIYNFILKKKTEEEKSEEKSQEEKSKENEKNSEEKETEEKDSSENNNKETKEEKSGAEGVSENSQSAAKWVIDRGVKVLDIIQFPYNKEKLQAYIAKKIDSFNFSKNGELKSKGALFGVTLRWIGLIVLIFMIANYAAMGGLIAVGGYLGARLGRKAVSKLAMYSGKKYAENQISKADKKAKNEYENLENLSKEEYLKKYTWAGFDPQMKKLALIYTPYLKNNSLYFIHNTNKDKIITKENFNAFSKLLDTYLLLYSNLSGKQGKYFNKNVDSNKTYINAYNKLKEIDEGL